ncbi:GNAT family N-acetyltransferase [Lentzea californiensis]|uniref:GNAT family N-acetyltransferase n=1 Tax=Lentzea californiensis TaxID=438851 RepID=UPI002164A9B5|nr:GNAT family N-acetyltransferase [Lentzea californiensis]MCR3746499.1 Acetyltransferase (GNAT) family protein [Lentzea californiensis]
MIEGLTWRPLTRDDAQTSADLLNAIEAVDKIGENYTAEDTLTELVDPYADLERGSLAVFDGDVMAGYMKIQYRPTATEVHRVSLDGGVHPSYRRQGIGTRLVRAGIESARVLHALHHPALRLAINVHKAEHISGLAELLSAAGFTPVRYFQRMEHALLDVEPSDDPRIEPWSEAADEEFRHVRNEAYRANWGATPMPVELWKNKITNQTFQPLASFLLREAGGVAAGLLVTMNWEADTEATGVRDAHFMVIGTLPGYRNRGVASALLSHALRAAVDQGYDRALLSVDSENATGAFGIFERAGFTSTMRFVRWELEG